MVFLPRKHNLNLITKKHQATLNQGTFYEITDLYYSKMSMSWNTKKDWKLKRYNQKQGWPRIFICYKRYCWENWKNMSKIRYSIVSILISWFDHCTVAVTRKFLVFRKYTMNYWCVKGLHISRLLSKGSERELMREKGKGMDKVSVVKCSLLGNWGEG